MTRTFMFYGPIAKVAGIILTVAGAGAIVKNYLAEGPQPEMPELKIVSIGLTLFFSPAEKTTTNVSNI